MKKIVGVLLPLLLLVLVGSAVGCGGESYSPPTAAPTATPAPTTTTALTPTPTQTPVPTTPPQFTNYTDNEGLFSISYPQDWEAPLWMLEDLEEATQEVIESTKSGLPLDKVSVLFFAGLSTAQGWDPNLNIAVEPVPAGTLSLDGAVDAAVRGVNLVCSDYNELSREKTSVGGRDATIIDFEATMGSLPKGHYLLMCMLQEKVLWVLTCTTDPAKFIQYEDTFYKILQSFRILK